MAEYGGCEVCVYKHEGKDGEHCGKCVHNCSDNFKRATNADRIRSMTDEELARELVKHHMDDVIKFCRNMKECDDILDKGIEVPEYMCEKCLLEWLQKESEGE